jgi:hypothetical protein
MSVRFAPMVALRLNVNDFGSFISADLGRGCSVGYLGLFNALSNKFTTPLLFGSEPR